MARTPAMARRSAETMSQADEAITRGTGKVFADLGYADGDERQTKLRLAYAINGVIARRRVTQAAAAEKLRVNQPKVSALKNYKLDGFSVERLMTFLTALDRDVEIVIKKKPRARSAARISVIGVNI
jgi:predicted XRE-type DNA-binding protein